MMTKSECQEMLDKGRFRTNLIGKKILKSHLELYELLKRQKTLSNVAYDCLTGKEEKTYDDLDS